MGPSCSSSRARMAPPIAAADMHRIFRPSGEELAVTSMEEVRDVKELKAALRSLYSFPLCLQQLLHNGSILDDSAKLTTPIDMELVLFSIPPLGCFFLFKSLLV